MFIVSTILSFRLLFSIELSGYYSDKIPVAVKIVGDEESIRNEVEICKVLNAIGNLRVQHHGIPAVYYYGRIFQFYGIAMSLFEGNLENYYRRAYYQQKNISYSELLSIFKQTVSK